jgi:hypothetical protein
MSNYFIGIGGTGAKCVEALVHLSAAGLMPKGDLYVLFVDPDKANGSLGNAQVVLNQYRNCQTTNFGTIKIKGGENFKPDLFKTNITTSEPNVWTPFKDKTDPKLEDEFQYNVLRQSNPDVANLFDVFYSKKERETNLSKGFRGHPSIGAAVFANTIEFEDSEPWSSFRHKIERDSTQGEESKIFLCGSIFGGTGASGLPTIARLIKNEIANLENTKVKLGASLILPYFSFTFPSTDRKSEMLADSNWFIPNSKSALKYYHQKKYAQDIFETMYVIGDESQSEVKKASVGGNDQQNDPHFIELYSALGAIDFFGTSAKDGVMLVSRERNEYLQWEDLPHSSKKELKTKLELLTKFAIAFNYFYEPALQNITPKNKYQFPWYIDLVERNKINIKDTDTTSLISELKNYCENFLRWIACIHCTASNEQIKLFQWTSFAEFNKEDLQITLKAKFDNEKFIDISNIAEEDNSENGFNKVWKNMCIARTNKDASGLGTFIRALFDSCNVQ